LSALADACNRIRIGSYAVVELEVQVGVTEALNVLEAVDSGKRELDVVEFGLGVGRVWPAGCGTVTSKLASGERL